MDQISFVEVFADFMQIISHNEIALILLQKSVSHINQFFMRNAAQKLEADQFRFWTELLNDADDFRGSLHMDDEIIDI